MRDCSRNKEFFFTCGQTQEIECTRNHQIFFRRIFGKKNPKKLLEELSEDPLQSFTENFLEKLLEAFSQTHLNEFGILEQTINILEELAESGKIHGKTYEKNLYEFLGETLEYLPEKLIGEFPKDLLRKKIRKIRKILINLIELQYLD